MGTSHKDFFRTLPNAVTPYDYQIEGSFIYLANENKKIKISLSKEWQRKIANISIPVTEVRLDFSNFQEDEITVFMRKFDSYFRKGGG